MRTVTTMVAGSTRTTTGLTTGGIMTTGSRSPCRNSLHFSPAFAGEFCFVSCPFQPPSILPTSSNFTERAMYLLIVQRFCFPEHQKKHAESVRFLDRETNIRMFLPERESWRPISLLLFPQTTCRCADRENDDVSLANPDKICTTKGTTP